MFQNFSNNLSKVFERLRNRGVVTEANIDETMREIRVALLEADVALPVIKDFLTKVSEKAKGQTVIKSISAGQLIIKIIHDELITLLSTDRVQMELNLKAQSPVNILIAGLQGSGKTTTSAKLALKLKEQGKRVLLVSTDIYRPAAQEQLAILADKIAVESLSIINGQPVIQIVQRAIEFSKSRNFDVVIYDTAGRLHIDEDSIEELKQIKQTIKPTETLLVLDSLTGQDAVNIANLFNQAVSITGVVLTRVDGDSRGGAALSVRFITGAPIKFIGVGEGMKALEAFQPERVASRILGMGDVVSLVEKAMDAANQDEMEKTVKRMQAGKFDLNDYAGQLNSIEKMGGVTSIMSMLPGFSRLQQNLPASGLSDKPIKRQLAIIGSMTKLERKKPDILAASRKRRIASGAGTSVQEVNKLLKQYQQIAGLMKKFKGGGLGGLMSNFSKMFK